MWPPRGILSNFIEITLRHGCSPVNLLHNFRTPFSKDTSGWLLLKLPNDRLLVRQKPFSKVVLDYFGPLMVKLRKCIRSNQSTVKKYRAFYMLKTSHAASNMSIGSIFLALTWFIYQRDCINIKRFNNRTNFVSAEKNFKKALKI